MDANGTVVVGHAKVMTTDHGGLRPEQVAELCLDKLIAVSDTAPEPIRAQALAYREAIRQTLVHYMTMAANGQRTTIVAQLQAAGHADVAELIKEI